MSRQLEVKTKTSTRACLQREISLWACMCGGDKWWVGSPESAKAMLERGICITSSCFSPNFYMVDSSALPPWVVIKQLYTLVCLRTQAFQMLAKI